MAKESVSVSAGAVDHLFERDIFLALGAADQAHLLEVVLSLEQVTLFGMPHAVIGPGQRVIGIGGKRFVVPVFGFVVAAELAAGIAEQGRHVRVIVIADGAQCCDTGLVIALVVNERIGGVITVQEILGRTALAPSWSYAWWWLCLTADCFAVVWDEPIAATNSGTPEMATASMVAVSNGVLRMGSSGFFEAKFRNFGSVGM